MTRPEPDREYSDAEALLIAEEEIRENILDALKEWDEAAEEFNGSMYSSRLQDAGTELARLLRLHGPL